MWSLIPLHSIIYRNDRLGQTGWLIGPWGREQKELPSLPSRVRQDYFVQPLQPCVERLKLLAGPQCPKQEPFALTEHSWRACSRKCWWLPGALSGAVLLVLCVLYCGKGGGRCVLKKH